jgi:zinc/manganese transport system substrate-binding protein
MLTRRNVIALSGVAALLGARQARAQQKMRVVATFSILGDLAKNMGGERAIVDTLVGSNADVHTYSPAAGDAKALAAAPLVFINGLGLEGWISRLIVDSGTTAHVVSASNGIKPLDMRAEDHAGAITVDPHAWQSIANAKVYVANIRDGFVSADQTYRDIYDANATAYIARLDALEKEVKSAINRIPPERRKIITTHDAFGYFADAYVMQFIAPEGVSTDAEPSARDVAQIVSQIRQQKIPAVFIENITDPRLMQLIAKETGARIGGTLYSDALSEPNGPAATYIEMMRHNVHELEKALTG